MKIILKSLAVILVTSITLMGCNGSANNTETQLQKEDTTTTSTDLAGLNEKNDSSPTEIKEATVECRIYFENDDAYDEETGELIQKASVEEREEFWEKKEYTFCYDSERFKKITLSGSGENISFAIFAGKRQVFSKSNMSLTGKLIFTSKDFLFDPGEKYKIEIKQGEKVLFNGKLDSQGCM